MQAALKLRAVSSGTAISVSADRRRYGHIYISILFVRTNAKETPNEGGGKQNPTKASIPPSLLRFLLCTPLPYPLTPTLPAFTVTL